MPISTRVLKRIGSLIRIHGVGVRKWIELVFVPARHFIRTCSGVGSRRIQEVFRESAAEAARLWVIGASFSLRSSWCIEPG